MSKIAEAVLAALGVGIARLSPLSGGCVGDVFRADMADGRKLVVKAGGAGSQLDLEGWMLTYLKDHSALPVPEVIHAEDGLLVMGFIKADGTLTARAQEDAARLLAALHQVTAPAFGLDRPTLIGGLRQPNPWTPSWREFFRDQRLLYMAREALDHGRLPTRTMARIEALAGRLDRWIGDDARPALIHGDMWSGNVLCGQDRIAGFVDPAIYYADPEIELAFSTLFGTFGEAFFHRYDELSPIRPGFFEERCRLYNLYPLLVHARLFGGSYAASVARTLEHFGC